MVLPEQPVRLMAHARRQGQMAGEGQPALVDTHSQHSSKTSLKGSVPSDQMAVTWGLKRSTAPTMPFLPAVFPPAPRAQGTERPSHCTLLTQVAAQG